MPVRRKARTSATESMYGYSLRSTSIVKPGKLCVKQDQIGKAHKLLGAYGLGNQDEVACLETSGLIARDFR